MEFIDSILDKITMYRVVLYYLIALLGLGTLFGSLGIINVNPLMLLFTTILFLAFCWITNKIFSIVFEAPTNLESVYITALILALIIRPASSIHDLPMIFWASVLSMSSKYILAINKKHIFNPVAIAVYLTSLGFGGSANWWIGTASLAPFVFTGGLLVIKKIRREDFIFSFLATAILTVLGFSFLSSSDLATSLNKVVANSSLLFLAFVMLTEPLTTPPTKKLQIIYALIVGFLFAPQIHIGNFYTTPEMALCIGNIFSFIVSPKYKLMLKLKEKINYGIDTIDFDFLLDKKINFAAGQYMEWTLPHKNPDSRGNRRYFTIASSPTENSLKLGVKFYPNGSSFKRNMEVLDNNTTFVGGQLAGDFTLPKDKNKKLVFIAGGIGITPYRSMIKFLIDTKEKRDITIIYSNKLESEIAYKNVFDHAFSEMGIKTIYTLTDEQNIPSNWTGEKGRINANMIQEYIPDFKERLFYLSGPHVMIEAFEKVLKDMGVKGKNIKKDFFPGLV